MVSPIKTVLVIGANRGIGLQFIKTLKQQGWSTIGSIRPETRGDSTVDELIATGSRIVEIDYKDENTIKNAAKEFEDVKLDVLINCAGMALHAPSWHDYSKADLLSHFEVMTIGPLLACKHFLPHLLRAPRATIANISSSMGSISTNIDARVIGYKMAKAALNQLTVTLANDFKARGYTIGVVALEPGAIQTRISKFNGDVDIVESVERMVELIGGVMPEGEPRFLDWRGRGVGW
ncbi:short chain dehydrogenase [Ophiobolus disseminans]|uniref:Short chain dehydrogenase n=1 Tax=Ophiobolus disseminans TaxID=1469910 RepID=A0A6A7AJF2_9PLEO|nr:short chain dehydrogenase [Ophiobolus disseminans]